LLKVWVKKARN